MRKAPVRSRKQRQRRRGNAPWKSPSARRFGAAHVRAGRELCQLARAASAAAMPEQRHARPAGRSSARSVRRGRVAIARECGKRPKLRGSAAASSRDAFGLRRAAASAIVRSLQWRPSTSAHSAPQLRSVLRSSPSNRAPMPNRMSPAYLGPRLRPPRERLEQRQPAILEPASSRRSRRAATDPLQRPEAAAPPAASPAIEFLEPLAPPGEPDRAQRGCWSSRTTSRHRADRSRTKRVERGPHRGRPVAASAIRRSRSSAAQR